MGQEKLYTIPEIADLLSVHEQTVRVWIRNDELPAILLGRRAGYRIRQSDLNEFLRRRQDGGGRKGEST